ncbi:MAG: FumA C-terminus/TtdB family hydratase beta subunit [Candidatus Thermoplasmatota archaeon]|nr:FumA C-terminus/TtdB family hydratase beta subunit [Candidatus Thermoplasmatota archaeon]
MTKRLKTPLSENDVRSLNVGEAIYLDGVVYTGRDEVHIHALEYLEKGKNIPVDFKGAALFHCGPIMRKVGEEWEVVAAGPTTSSRMNSLEPQFIEKFRPGAIIGKGGMSQPTIDAMKQYGCVYLAITGGAAVLAAKGLKSVSGVEWYELGMPEAVWILNAENFGPLTVGIDTHGKSLFADVSDKVKENEPAVRERLGLKK